MGHCENNDFFPRPELANVNAVTIASCAIQQLPKLFHAMSNMARRSRRQLHRKGIFLGGQWLEKGSILTSSSVHLNIPEEAPKRKGILKKNREPCLDQQSACNEFWSTYTFSFLHDGKPIHCHGAYNIHCRNSCWCFFRRTTPQAFYCSQESDKYQSPSFSFGQLCIQNLQGCLQKSQTLTFLDSFPSHMTSLQSLQNILFRHLSKEKLNILEQEILFQLQYLKILFNTPLHKLVRERPKEFLVPLPRRHPRGPTAIASRPYYARSLTTHQTVLTLPNPEQNLKWLSLTNLAFGRNPLFGFGSNNNGGECSRYKKRSSTTVPKGVAFITYPDSVDETSFEGTIGGRNIISWEEGTRFPQLGIDQSNEFKYKKEMGKQQMIQNRLRAARIYRRIYCDNWNNYVNGDREGSLRRVSFTYAKKKGFRRNKTSQGKPSSSAPNSLFKSWFKLAHLKQSIRALNDSMRSNGNNNNNLELSREQIILPPNTGGNNSGLTSSRRRAVKNAERRRRIKICLLTVAKFLSCGLVQYFTKGECRLFKRRKLRTSDSRERCPTPPLPKVDSLERIPAVKELKCEKIPP